MDWSIVLAVILFVATVVLSVVLAFKLTKRKKPVWACNTRKIIGIGSNAPPELQMTFNGSPVDDVYQTVFIFFNRGTETIRKDDIAEAVAIHFEGAKILRPPTILATGKEANNLLVRHLVKDGDEAVEVDFIYLDHGDGVVVEVFHTKPERIRCSGIIMGTNEIDYIGAFLPSRPPEWQTLYYALMAVVGGSFTYFSVSELVHPVLGSPDLKPFLIFTLILGISTICLLVYILVASPEGVPVFYRYLKFPKWASLLKLPWSE